MTTGQEWDGVPCGLLTLRRDGTVLAANRTFLDWIGRDAAAVVGRVRLADVLSVGGRIYWETHLSPLLHVEGRLDEVALELRSSGGRMPVLVSAVVPPDRDVVLVAVSGAGERLRYERELEAARRAAERSATQVSTLQGVTAALSTALGVDGVVDALLDAAVGPLGAAAATVWVPGADDRLVVHGVRGEPPAGPPLHRAQLGVRGAVAEGERVVIALQGQASLRGLLSVRPRLDPAADPLDLEVLGAVGQQAGLALDRARLYEHSAGVARALQHSLLAVDPPVDPRYDVATTYRPGVEMLEVGGDWYDVFVPEAGVLSFVVGDVVGRGLGAASTMGQLRSAVRAVAGPGVGPARLLSRLDRFAEQVEAAGMATLAYAELDLESGAVRYACAGHPPPVLLPAQGGGRLLWGGRSTPLGAYGHGDERGEAQVQLLAGDRLLLYTDGLVERRDRPLDDGFHALVVAATTARTEPLGNAVRNLTRDMLRDEQGRDDVCVLLLSWSGPVFARRLPSDLSTLSAVRGELRAWLAAQGVDAAGAEDVVLAASEAVANAAEHGSPGGPGDRVDLEVRRERRPADSPEPRDEIVVRVRDRGRWRSPSPAAERGRGLLLMRALMDEVLVEPGDGTTVVLRRRVEGRAA